MHFNSRTNVTNISSGGSNRGGSGGKTFSSKKPRQKGLMDHFFTPNAEIVIQNWSRKMNQTIINDAYKKEAKKRAYMLITRWMYEVVVPFNTVTYPSFQPMIEAIGQYGVRMKGPTFHEVRITNLKK